jgi:GNAT superfamily N-acetyltransferase
LPNEKEFNLTKHIISPVRNAADLKAAGDLFLEYANWLADDHGISLEFQGFEQELAGLPGKYAPPRGEILLARLPKGDAEAVIAIRPFEGDTCEIKRLYVAPSARGHALGKTLIAAIITCAREAGYTRAILDTGSFMQSAQHLYESFGFTDIEKYYDNPVPNVRYMGCDL